MDVIKSALKLFLTSVISHIHTTTHEDLVKNYDMLFKIYSELLLLLHHQDITIRLDSAKLIVSLMMQSNSIRYISILSRIISPYFLLL